MSTDQHDGLPHRCIVCPTPTSFPNVHAVNVHIQSVHGKLLHQVGTGYIRDLSRCNVDAEDGQGRAVLEFVRTLSGVRGPDDFIDETVIGDGRIRDW